MYMVKHKPSIFRDKDCVDITILLWYKNLS
jgi:hypothetical protein